MAWEIVVHRVVQAWLLSLGAKDYFRYIFMTITGKGSGDRVVPRNQQS
jgi:hypothetical protein